MDLTQATDEELERRERLCSKAAENYADHVYALKIYESLCNDLLAALKMKFRGEVEGKISEAELECKARASEEWKAFRKEQMEVLRQAGRKKVIYDNAYMRWDSMRSRLSAKAKEISR